MSKSRILTVGQALGSLAAQAFPGAAVESLDAAALVAPSIAPETLDLVLIETQAADPGALARLVEGMAAWRRPPAAIFLGEHLPAALARALFRLERSDVLSWPLSAIELARAAAPLLNVSVAAPTPTHQSRCWSVMGAVGGSGGTTLAIELACGLAARNAGRVALFDLNLADGAASAYLGVPGNMRLAEAAATPERIDAAVLEAFGLPSGAGFDLFAAPRDPHGFSKVTPAAVCRLLEVACEVYDFILIDLPRHRQPWTADVLAGSDEVILVSELTVPALLSARALTSEVEAELPSGRRPRIVLNRMAARVFGPAPSRAEAEKALGRKVDGAITSDWEAAACSVNLGGAISQHRPRSKIVKDVIALVDFLAPVEVEPEQRSKASR
ncbi:AAA family ATPase [Phenylobacterium montanum]|uniref:AAA family ATPase n=1 Tax=Phenylobacterium montanum TaxID=2823693 RepID=A0A975FV85_9CAUL|nr:AAA family ATPase [Caulobacter sp. S6]QUD86015.1 AAA family ATPase [Caulobacter sp. S6]